MNLLPEGTNLYIPAIGDELLLTKPLPVEIAVRMWSAIPDPLIKLFNYEKEAYVDEYGNSVGFMDKNRVYKELKIYIPAGVYIRVRRYQVYTRSGRGTVHFEVSGMTEEVRKTYNVSKRRNCRNFGKFALPFDKTNKICYLPATDPTFENDNEDD